jgi:hypothetical protein
MSNMHCTQCGSLLSAVTWACVRGQYCKPANRQGYSATAVDKAIQASNRSGRHISAREAKAIHALLKGRE